MSFSTPRVAIVHYWLVTNRGGEKVLERICNMFPQADIFTHVYDPDADLGPVIKKHRIRTSFINDLPFAKTKYQNYLPLMPLALEQLDLTGYDLIISSEAGPAKGTVRHPDATQICYVHSPMRYIWDQYSVYRENFGFLAKRVSPLIFHYLRMWDFASAQRVDSFAANSAFVSRRIEMTYRRPSRVIYPPVAVADFNIGDVDLNDYYLWAGALVPYKRPDLAVDTCTALGRKLLVVGQGPMEKELKARAGPNVIFRRRLPFSVLKQAFASCKGLLFTGEEDFGITPVEFMASGRPVLALGRGGALETVVQDQTGRFFQHATRDGLVEAITGFEKWLPHFDPAAARARAAAFAPERFDEGLRALVREHGIDTEQARPLRSIG